MAHPFQAAEKLRGITDAGNKNGGAISAVQSPDPPGDLLARGMGVDRGREQAHVPRKLCAGNRSLDTP